MNNSENFINILLVIKDHKHINGLREILLGNGNNILSCFDLEETIEYIKKKEVGILIVDIDAFNLTSIHFFEKIRAKSRLKNNYIIALTGSAYLGVKMVKSMSEGVIDYMTLPLNPNLVKAKIDVYKALFLKDQKINHLLQNIFPENVLNSLNKDGYFTPTRFENGVVLFTDFVHFSQKSKSIKPLDLLKKLEYYFNQFDDTIERYKLEKIKTIGDSYMVIGGVTETNKEPAIRACLAALEIRDFMLNEKAVASSIQSDYWEIRIGIHSGPLVAGIIGTKKISFDVWGDTVNIASRAEHNSSNNQITITSAIKDQLGDYFECEDRGSVEIKTRGGQIRMYFLNRLKKENSLYGESKIPNQELRIKCELTNIDLVHMRKDILNRLKSLLPDEVVYHDITHTLNVEKAALRYAQLEGLTDEETYLLQTAVLFHDAGFIVSDKQNEPYAMQLAKNTLPKYGYTEEQIQIIVKIIESTQYHQNSPETLLEQIMKDADHDYLGRDDYYPVAEKLREELENYGKVFTEKEWVQFQLHYLENVHKYYTQTAINIRQQNKINRIEELKSELERL